jgi:hypothetical protein
MFTMLGLLARGAWTCPTLGIVYGYVIMYPYTIPSVKGRCRVGNVLSLLTNAVEKERSGVLGLTSRVFIHVTQSCHLHWGEHSHTLQHTNWEKVEPPNFRSTGKQGFTVYRMTKWSPSLHSKAHQVWAINASKINRSKLPSSRRQRLLN